MSGYSKLFSSILASTIWEADMPTRIVWITLLAMSNAKGKVEGSVPGLATFARVTLPEARAALENLKAPDPDSRSREEEGRRIRDIEGGWLIINYAKYRNQLNQEERREYLRVKQSEYRRKQTSTNVDNVSDKSTPLTQAEAEAEADPKASKRTTPLPPSKQSAPAALDGLFAHFWTGYPKKVGKGAALTAWRKIKPSEQHVENILSALALQRHSDQWQRDDGRFIPNPATWLNQGRWDDELPSNGVGNPHGNGHGNTQASNRVRAAGDGPSRYVAPDADWFDECKVIHGGACELDRMRHFLRVQSDKLKAG